MVNDVAAFWSKVFKRRDGCWIWEGAGGEGGYGIARWQGKKQQAHRVSLLIAGETIPAGQVIHHKCRVPRCVNPAHLEIVPVRVHAQLDAELRRDFKERWRTGIPIRRVHED